jgi:hypothetical protein
MDQSNKAAGPGAIVENTAEPGSTLDGASEYEYVTIFNPLSVDFVGQVGQSKPVNVPFQIRRDQHTAVVSTSEAAVQQNYGLSLKNKDHAAKMPIVNRIVIPSGQMRNILGNEAQVIVRQLVNEILQREGNKLHLADPHQRRLVEARVIRTRKSVEEILGTAPQAISDQLQGAIDKSNEQQDEQEFPDLDNTAKDPTNGEQSTRRRSQQPKIAASS